MKEIKFRGKRIDNGEWVYGTLVVSKNSYYIVTTNAKVRWMDWNYCEIFGIYRVIPKSIGQFTGQKDKNNDGIYEGDIVRDFGMLGEKANERIGIVIWDSKEARFDIKSARNIPREWSNEMGRWWSWEEIEVIGNIHENPELLKEAKP